MQLEFYDVHRKHTNTNYLTIGKILSLLFNVLNMNTFALITAHLKVKKKKNLPT